MTDTTNSVFLTDRAEIKKCSVRFRSVELANAWLSNQDSIVITNMDISTTPNLGFPFNYICVTEVCIGYIRYPYVTGNAYSISESDHSSLYISKKLEKLRDKWIENNPDKYCVFCLKRSSKRHIIGVKSGIMSFVRDKFLVLYKHTGEKSDNKLS